MREFILLALKSWSSPEFSVDNLADAGRMDVVCTTISNTLYYSHHIRQDTLIHVVLNGPKYPPKVVTFDGSKLQGMDFDAKSIAFFVQSALKKGLSLKMNEKIDVSPGLTVMKNSFEGLVKEKVASGTQLVYLHPKGKDVREFDFKDEVCLVFGDFKGIPRKAEKFLERFLEENKAEKITLGPAMLFASHCPIIVHNELDRIHTGWKR